MKEGQKNIFYVTGENNEAAVISMGIEVSELDLENIKDPCSQAVSLSEYRVEVYDYLKSRMNTIAPNLTTLVGELVGARLIAHGGSLLNLAKQPGSTVQILGAEKALFRALKTKHATPKYGLIYHVSLVGQAAPKHKGKISRSLAAKAALAIRCDALGEGEVFPAGTLDSFAIFVWSRKPGQLLDILNGQKGPVHGLLFSPSTATLAFSSWDKSVRLWESRKYICMHAATVAACLYFGLLGRNLSQLCQEILQKEATSGAILKEFISLCCTFSSYDPQGRRSPPGGGIVMTHVEVNCSGDNVTKGSTLVGARK